MLLRYWSNTLQENRLAQLATVDQQRELMRYMRGLNEWLEQDVHDRQNEIRGVHDRVDRLGQDVRNLLRTGMLETAVFVDYWIDHIQVVHLQVLQVLPQTVRKLLYNTVSQLVQLRDHRTHTDFNHFLEIKGQELFHM